MHSGTKDINQLKHDILNGPYHVFGFHAHCNPQFCNVAKQRQHPNMESQEECNLQTGEEDEVSHVRLYDFNTASLPGSCMGEGVESLVQT